jgi:hypothetical protein
MAGYSGTPLLKKLGIKVGDRVLLRHAPAALPEELKENAKARLQDRLDVIILFARSFAEFKREFAALQGSMKGSIKADGMIWVAWPKKASGMQTDLTDNAIRDTALKTVFVDVKICAIDETWSGLKFVVRKEHRSSFDQGLNRN